MSEEQRNVYNHINEGKNVIVDACAGSGKSTTILSIARELPDVAILQFTYNSMLRHEIREKVQELELENLEVHTYHSFGVKYYSTHAHTDTGIRSFLLANTPPRNPLNKYDLVVLDECQDMTLLYFQLVATMVRDMCIGTDHKIQLLVLGDYMQGLYEFKGADIRFLTEATSCWKGFSYLKSQEFIQATLQTSYRITNQMADFVNKDMLGEQRIKACRDGGPVVYIRRPRYILEKIVVYNIKQLLEQGESPSDIFVLGGSVKGPNSPIRKMENVLTQNDIPCHVPMFETDAMDERVIEGKVVFSTFHTVKGRQRKYVFVVGFDNSYFFIARDLPKDKCPN
jgi:superfamily I DNA/RNA helicase